MVGIPDVFSFPYAGTKFCKAVMRPRSENRLIVHTNMYSVLAYIPEP